MLKYVSFFFIFLLFIPFTVNARWVSLTEGAKPGTPPQVELLGDDDQGTVIKVELSGFEVNDFLTEGKLYHQIDLLSEAVTSRTGYPEIPHIAKLIAVPDRAVISVEVLETGRIYSFTGYHLPPVRKSWKEGDPEPFYEENPKIYQSDAIYPETAVKTDPPVIFRDFRLVRVAIFPLRYIPGKNEIRVASSVTIRVNYGTGKAVNPKTTPRRPIAPSFAAIYRGSIFNYQSVLQRKYNGEETGRDVMLCIMNDNYVNSFQVFADWKHRSGTYIKITKFSDIGANANNPEIIKNHITDAYHNWQYPPTHILVVGDYGYFPVKYVTYDYTFVNEDYFVEIDGNDFFPEMMIGRFTNQSDYRMRVMINKFLKYERTPYTANTDWFKKGLCCSNNAYYSQVKTKRFTARVMMQDGGFISVDTLMSNGNPYTGIGCTMGVSDIQNIITEGRSFLNYRGEGWTSGWNATCYHFHTSDVMAINNGEKLTFVTSIGCGVAMFDAGGGNCFGETWVQMGTLTNPRGAIAFIGPTSNTHTTYNNRIDKGIYVGMFREGMDQPGQALLRGKLYMYNVFGNDPWVEYHYRVFCVLGDPSARIWKDIPQAVTVVHPASISIGYEQVHVQVTTASNGTPIENAEVCLSGDNIYATGFTGPDGKVILHITPEAIDTLSIVVRGGNVIPYEGNIAITSSTQHVGPLGDPTIVDLNGNMDGLINPNENCQITFQLKNWGTQGATNVQATLSADTSYVRVLTTSPVAFGNLASGGSATGNPFEFYVKPQCPVGYVIPFNLNITSAQGNWDYIIEEEVKGCRLVYTGNIVDDQGNPKHNFRMDPGETVKFYVVVTNAGEDVAPNVKGFLKTDNPHVTILDSTGAFGTLEPDSSGVNSANYFVVKIDTNTQSGYEANFVVNLNTQNGNYPYQTSISFTVPIGIPNSSDPTGPDAYGYYAISSDDTLFNTAPDYNWIEIKQVGTEIPIAPGVSDYTKTVNLPFPFQYYGLTYTHIRISTDGWVAFGSGTQTAWQNHSLPHNDNINCMVAAFWDDLFAQNGETGKLYYYNDAANHRFIIEWYGVGHYNDNEDRETFQIILLDPAYYPTVTGDGEIIFQYHTLVEIGGNTVGIEDNSQSIGLEWVYNDIYDSTASRLKDGFAIKFTTELPTLVSVNEDDGAPGENLLPTRFSLDQNYPNPFNPQTHISYALPTRSRVTLKIYNIRGQLVRTLKNETLSPGRYSVIWDGKNDWGNRVSSGVYFYRLAANGSNGETFIQTKKLILLK